MALAAIQERNSNILKSSGISLPPPQKILDFMNSMANKSIVWGGNYFVLPPSRNFLIWDKGPALKGRCFSECEYAWCSWDGNARTFLFNPTRPSHAQQKQHPTQKPLELMVWCVDLIPEAKTILDPYMGSGTTGVAAIQLGRKFIGIEKEERYFDIACKRVEQAHAQGKLFEPERAKQEQMNLVVA